MITALLPCRRLYLSCFLNSLSGDAALFQHYTSTQDPVIKKLHDKEEGGGGGYKV